MFKSISISAALLVLATSNLSAEVLTPVGFRDLGAGSAELVTSSPSVLVVNLEVERVSEQVGVYARYAQKYLGVRASLVAKESYSIVGADVSMTPEDYHLAGVDQLGGDTPEVLVSSVSERLPIDLNSSDRLSIEEAAEEAAEAIFAIRQLRRDLLTGELGEGFYGGGLASALERLQWEEEQYAELFFGRVERSRMSYTRYVPVVDETLRYIVCRFNPDSGVVDGGDLSAEPVLLQLTPVEGERLTAPEIVKSRTVQFRVPSVVRCDLYSGADLVASKAIPLVEFGYDIDYPISSK